MAGAAAVWTSIAPSISSALHGAPSRLSSQTRLSLVSPAACAVCTRTLKVSPGVTLREVSSAVPPRADTAPWPLPAPAVNAMMSSPSRSLSAA